MKISEQWLREWVNPDISTHDLAHLMTMAGMEVTAVAPVAGDFSGVVVAQILSREQHPNADRLSLCQVDTGAETVQIVCAAPNARAGLKAPLARVGAVLPGDFKIKKARLRGVESRGMLCAAAELGLGDASDGLMELAAEAPVGTDLRDYLKLDDRVIELDLTPNRADCLGLRGLAREVGLLTRCQVKPAEFEPVAVSISDELQIVLSAVEGCPRYLGRIVKAVDVSVPSPVWLRERLRRSGLRSINCVVDVTNYVLLELGQPMHAFDLDKLQGRIDVRWAGDGESLQLLDGQTLELQSETLLITDDSGPIALAGIMGGQSTAVSDTTRNIMFEAAFFAPQAIIGKARAYGLHTDSSHRFERGVDYQLQDRAMERATQLLLDTAGGEAGPIVVAAPPSVGTVSRRTQNKNVLGFMDNSMGVELLPDIPIVAAALPSVGTVSLRRARIKKMLGFAMDDSEVERIFQGLGMAVESHAEGWTVSVPGWRFDIAIEADLLEELARVYGYNKLPVSHISANLVMPSSREQVLSIRAIRRRLAARDYQEAITYSFVDPQWQRAFDSQLAPVALQNPISADLAVMRTSLLPGLMQALLHNVHRQQQRVRLFETGLRFLPTAKGLRQQPTLAGVMTGRRSRENWNDSGDMADFYDVKGDLEAVFALTGNRDAFRFEAGEREGLHPGQTALVYRGEALLGYIGALHPGLQKSYDVAAAVYLFEVDLEAVQQARLPGFTAVSKYPEQRRDIAVIVDKSVPAGELLENVRAVAGTYLTDLRLFDVYEGKGIDPKRKSLALGLTFQDSSRTLSDDDVNKSKDQVIDLLIKTYNAELRS